ncbi:MAG: Hsp20/alpha crystallin family protein [Pseudomonadota bacterium]
MTDIVTWDPFRITAGFPETGLRSLFDEDIFDLFPSFVRPAFATARSAAPMDVTADDNAYRVWVNLPGASKDAIQVSINENNVTISAEIPVEKAAGGEDRWLVRERACGRVSRTLTLPEAVDEASAEAKYRDGVLMLTLPKKVAAKRLTIH